MLRVPYIANRPGAYLLFFVLSFPYFLVLPPGRLPNTGLRRGQASIPR